MCNSATPLLLTTPETCSAAKPSEAALVPVAVRVRGVAGCRLLEGGAQFFHRR